MNNMHDHHTIQGKESVHTGHTMGDLSEMGFWGKFTMSMSMTMGMDHTGLAGREMARLMEIDIRNKFFFVPTGNDCGNYWCVFHFL